LNATFHPDDSRAHIFYANDLVRVDKIPEAKTEMQRAVELSPNDTLMLYNVACFFSLIDDKRESIDYILRAIENGYSNYDWMKRDTDLKNIRNEPEYIEIMKGK
jgi:Flp pilus assembly protein TadD